MKEILCCLIALITICIIINKWLNKKQNLQIKYNCSWVVVTGSTGGLGSALVQKLLRSNLNVIAVDYCADKLSQIPNTSQNKLVAFKFDFGSDLSQFACEFDKFLLFNNIDRLKIGVCFSNAGIGEFNKFDATSFESKRQYMQINFNSHLAVSDYFTKLFLSRSHDKKHKSALIFTSSSVVYAPSPYFSLYHTSKTAVTSLATALSTEYSKQIDILVVHPSGFAQSNFMYQQRMKPLFDFVIKTRNYGKKPLKQLTPDLIINRMLSRIGKLNCVLIGKGTKTNAIFQSIFGRNVTGYVWSCFKTLDKVFE
ncbi:Reductase [Hexamita inflata]|uniref:Putative n=1 Tax=Hexamita inflata TaxID=28002 RepID=A0AA86UIM3_9EUKA|nr:Reductase [Hexamita inflata]